MSKNRGGRPSKYQGVKPERIGFLVRPELKEKLQLLARMKNISMTDQIEKMIEEQIDIELSKAKKELLEDLKGIK